MSVLLHIADTHFGTEQPPVVEALVALAAQQRPDLVVLAGDITQRARPAQFRAAKAFVDRLGAPVLAVPGNHDIALFDLWARLTRPYARYAEVFGADLEPVHASADLLVVGVNTTRVGNGPFPTEFDDGSQSSLCQFIRDTGREYGVTTGRPRRCGYLDLVALRYACLANSIDSLVLTHLDVYDTLETFEACVAYKVRGRLVEHFPASVRDLEDAEPVLRSFRGWKRPLKEVREYDDLPREAKDYVSFIEEYTETSVDIVSVGYDRRDTIVRKSPWTRY